jgi:hypothetical protein
MWRFVERTQGSPCGIVSCTQPWFRMHPFAVGTFLENTQDDLIAISDWIFVCAPGGIPAGHMSSATL